MGGEGNKNGLHLFYWGVGGGGDAKMASNYVSNTWKVRLEGSNPAGPNPLTSKENIKKILKTFFFVIHMR